MLRLTGSVLSQVIHKACPNVFPSLVAYHQTLGSLPPGSNARTRRSGLDARDRDDLASHLHDHHHSLGRVLTPRVTRTQARARSHLDLDAEIDQAFANVEYTGSQGVRDGRRFTAPTYT